MQTYGLIVADNGSDMYITGSYDPRWDNDLLNPAFAALRASDFEVVELIISPDLVKDGDAEMIQDLTVAALNEAHRKVEESLKGKLGGMLPPGMM